MAYMNFEFCRKKPIVWFLCAALASLFSVSCTKSGSKNENAEWESHKSAIHTMEDDIQKLANDIKAAQGHGECKESEQCHVVGLWAKLCDGYTDFLVYSSKDVDEDRLLGLVQQINEKFEEKNKASLNVTRCGSPARPAQCIQQKCRVLN